MKGDEELEQFNNNEELCERFGGEFQPSGPPPIATQKFSEFTSKDSDSDGLQDTIDDVNGALDNVAGVVSKGLSKLTCDAECIAMPINIAFLAPEFFSILGVRWFDIGLPCLLGRTTARFTYPPMLPLSTLGGRIYILQHHGWCRFCGLFWRRTPKIALVLVLILSIFFPEIFATRLIVLRKVCYLLLMKE